MKAKGSRSVPRSERKILPKFGAYLRSLRERAKSSNMKKPYSRDFFAKKIGVSTGLLGEYEFGTCSDPKPVVLEKIAKFTGVELDVILRKLFSEKYKFDSELYYTVYLHKKNELIWEQYGLTKIDNALAKLP